MPRSMLDPGVSITETAGAISLITQYSGSFGHSMIAIEFLNGDQVQNIVAHLVALPSTQLSRRVSQMELMTGQAGGAALRTRILIQPGDDLIAKIATKLNCRSKTWPALNAKLNDAMLEIGYDASLSDTRNPARPDTHAADWQTSPYGFKLLGQMPMLGSQQSINCANWAVSILMIAGVRKAGGYVVDLPRSLTASGQPMSKL